MKTKHLIILAVFFLFFIIAIFLRKNHQSLQREDVEYQTLGFAFDPSQIGFIEISKGNKEANKVEIQNQNGIWALPQISYAKADQEKVTALLKAISKTKGELRSKEKSLFKDFGIEDEQAFEIILKDNSGRQLQDFLVGTQTAQGKNFLRHKGTAEVYITDHDLILPMGIQGIPETDIPKDTDWTDLRVFEFPEVAKLTEIEIDSKNGNQIIPAVKLQKNEGMEKWRFSRANLPFEISNDEVYRFVASMRKIAPSSVSHFEKNKDYGFSNPSLELRIKWGEGEKIFTVGKLDPESKNYFLKISRMDAVYEISKDQMDLIQIDDSHFFKNNPLDIDIKTLKQVTVHYDKKNHTYSKADEPEMKAFVDSLKEFKVTHLLFDEQSLQKLQSLSQAWIHLETENGETISVEFGDMLDGNKHEYSAKKNSAVPFAITEALFHDLFRFKNEKPREPEEVVKSS